MWQRLILIMLLTFIFFSIRVSFAMIAAEPGVEENKFMPDCRGLLPDEADYMLFLKKVAEEFVGDNNKKGDDNARKIFFLLGLRNNAILEVEDELARNSQKDIDRVVAEKLCELSSGKNSSDLWAGDKTVKEHISKNIDSLIKQTEQILKLSIQLRSKVQLSEKEKARREKKLELLSVDGEKKANSKVNSLKRGK